MQLQVSSIRKATIQLILQWEKGMMVELKFLDDPISIGHGEHFWSFPAFDNLLFLGVSFWGLYWSHADFMLRFGIQVGEVGEGLRADLHHPPFSSFYLFSWSEIFDQLFF